MFYYFIIKKRIYSLKPRVVGIIALPQIFRRHIIHIALDRQIRNTTHTLRFANAHARAQCLEPGLDLCRNIIVCRPFFRRLDLRQFVDI